MDPKPNPTPAQQPKPAPAETVAVPEIGGARRTTEPTRFGDWELNGKCVDF